MRLIIGLVLLTGCASNSPPPQVAQDIHYHCSLIDGPGCGPAYDPYIKPHDIANEKMYFTEHGEPLLCR